MMSPPRVVPDPPPAPKMPPRPPPGSGPAAAPAPGGPGGVGGTNPYVITFTGALKETPMPLIVAAGGTTPLSAGAARATAVNTTTGPNGPEVCITAANSQSG